MPIYSSNLKHTQFLALRNARSALLEKEFYLKIDKEDVNKDIVELNARLDSKYKRLDSICNSLRKWIYPSDKWNEICFEKDSSCRLHGLEVWILVPKMDWIQ